MKNIMYMIKSNKEMHLLISNLSNLSYTNCVNPFIIGLKSLFFIPCLKKGPAIYKIL